MTGWALPTGCGTQDDGVGVARAGRGTQDDGVGLAHGRAGPGATGRVVPVGRGTGMTGWGAHETQDCAQIVTILGEGCAGASAL